jgi:hypothetical protein
MKKPGSRAWTRVAALRTHSAIQCWARTALHLAPGALYTKTIFAEHADKVTYKVQFSQTGTYYLYMRFTMFENGGNLTSYGNEDSFFVPPDFGKDPQTDWPLPRGGYAEGCCDVSGFLFIKDDPDGPRVNHFAEDEEANKYWEGNFHWNQLISSQFNNPETAGEPSVAFKYEITSDRRQQAARIHHSLSRGRCYTGLFPFQHGSGSHEQIYTGGA